MLKRFLDKLEDPSAPFMGPYIKHLKFSGLLMPEKGRRRYFYMVLHTIQFIFAATEIIDLCYMKSDLTLLLYSMKIIMMAWVTLVKTVTFLSWQKRWKEILNYVNRTDIRNRTTDDDRNKKIISEITAFSRKVSYLYWLLGALTLVATCSAPALKYILSPTYRENTRNGIEEYMPVISSWLPFDKTTMTGYLVASTCQAQAAIVATLWITSFDTNAIGILTFFKCEIQLLRRDSSKIFGTEESPVNDEKAKKRIKECHLRHLEIIKYVELFNSCLSSIMMLYVIVCSIMICVTSYQITMEKNKMQQVPSMVYLLFQILQLFLYCWYSNDVDYESRDLYRGPYESLWWKKKVLRKDILILMIQFNKRIVLTVGPFADLALPTFISIMKGAYSYYTILSQSYEEN